MRDREKLPLGRFSLFCAGEKTSRNAASSKDLGAIETSRAGAYHDGMPALFVASPLRARRRGAIRLALLILIGAGLAGFALVVLWRGAPIAWPREPPTAGVGVLVSLSGAMAVSEAPLAAAARLAIDEINASGSIAGRRLEAHIVDGRSDPAVFAAEAERLIVEKRVSVLVGCGTSSCRQAVKPVVERHRHLLIYPLQYEGLEASPHILYTGLVPNQQLLPATHWAMRKFGKRVYLLGSDDVFSRIAHRMQAEIVTANGGAVVSKRLLPLGAHDMRAVIAEIERLRPDVLLNTLNGDSNAALIDALIKADLAHLPVLSFSLAEPEMIAWGGGRLTHHYAAWGYFQSIAGARNEKFVAGLARDAAGVRAASAPMEAAYVGLWLWAKAAREVGSVDVAQVNSHVLLRQTFAAPSGVAAIDASTRHLWKTLRIGRVLPNGQFEPVYTSPRPLRPAPWPSYRNREQWERILLETMR